MAKLWAALTSSRWGAFLAAGLLILLLVMTGQVFKTNLKLSAPELIYPGFFLAVALIIAGVVFAFLESTKEPSKGNNPRAAQVIAAKKYSVDFVQPQANSRLYPPLTLKGTIRPATLPDGWKLWLFNEGTQNGFVAFWPQEEAIKAGKGVWEVEYMPTPIYRDGDRRKLHIYLVGPDGQKLIGLYRQLNRHFALPQGGNFLGIAGTALTSDIVSISEMLPITLKKAKVPPPGSSS
jgi:hypothetical protein